MSRVVLVVFFLLASRPVYAEFGLGPCCGGFICGIIPCDNACAGSAFQVHGETVSELISQYGRNVDSLNQSIAKTESSYTEFGEKLTNTFDGNHSRLIDSLSAAIQKLETSLTGLTQSLVKNSDTIVTATNTSFRDVFLTGGMVDLEEKLSPNHMPEPLTRLSDIQKKIEVNQKKSEFNKSTIVEKYVVYLERLADMRESDGTNAQLDINAIDKLNRVSVASLLAPNKEELNQIFDVFALSKDPQSNIIFDAYAEVLHLHNGEEVANQNLFQALYQAYLTDPSVLIDIKLANKRELHLQNVLLEQFHNHQTLELKRLSAARNKLMALSLVKSR